MNLSDALSQYKEQLIGGLAGAAIGGGTLGLGTSRGENETPEEFEARRKQNAIIGAISGGALGTAGGDIYKRVSESLGKSSPSPGIISKMESGAAAGLNPLSNPVAGGVSGLGAGSTWGYIADSKRAPDSIARAIEQSVKGTHDAQVLSDFGRLTNRELPNPLTLRGQEAINMLNKLSPSTSLPLYRNTKIRGALGLLAGIFAPIAAHRVAEATAGAE